MIRFILLGLGIGALYGVSALGVVAIYRGSRVLNLAHGGLAGWGAYLFVRLRDDRDFPAWLAAASSVVICAAIGVVIYLVAIRPIRARTALTKTVMTLGVLAILQSLIVKFFGNNAELVRSSLPSGSVEILGARVGQDRMILLAIAVALTIVLTAWSARAKLALATRAMSEHEIAATSLGFRPHVIGAFNWGLGAALAGTAGMLVVPILGLSPNSLTLLVVPALAAALLGKFESYVLALAGGLAIGVTESLLTKYIDTPGWSAAAPFLFVVAALLFRRDRAANRLAAQSATAVSSGRFVPALAVPAVAATLLLLAFGTNGWRDATITTLAYSLIGLSLVVLIGLSNQVSLAQLAIAGLGALAAARLSLRFDMPFLLAPLVGAAVGAAAGVIVGLPALRIRGINLAVVTLGMGLAVEKIVLTNSDYSGGSSGLAVSSPTIFGLEVDAARYPERYGYVCLAWAILACLAVFFVRRSGFGRRVLAMRTNERAAASLGVGVARTKLAAFALASALAGMAGVLISYRNSPVVLIYFTSAESLNAVVVTVVAGTGGILGGLLAGTMTSGGIVFYSIKGWGWLSSNYSLIFGIGLVLTVLMHPEGIAATLRRKRTTHTELEPETSDARVPQTLRADDVVVNYGGVRAVDTVSLQVAPGEIVGLVGPNGAGKTSLLDAIGGFAPTTAGTVRLGDVDITSASPNRRAGLGMTRVFQAVELFEDLTVGQNIVLAAEAGGGATPLTEEARHAIGRFGLTEDLDTLPKSLSMAKRRFVGVARALAANPSILLLDEPGAGLSIADMGLLASELRRIAREQNIGVLLVDHDMRLIMDVCDRIVVLADGRPLAEGTPAEIQASQAVRDAYLGGGDRASDQPAQPSPVLTARRSDDV